MTPNLIPKPPKRKRQPTAEMMREQLRLAADEIIRLRTELDREPVTLNVPAGSFDWEPSEPPPNGYGYYLHADGRMTLESADRIASLLSAHRQPWWKRLWNRLFARLVETDPETAAQ
jgi:hypothetical protein